MRTLTNRHRSARLFKLSTATAALVAIACVLSGWSASAQDAVGPFPSEWGAPGTFVIRNARIVTVSGPEIENGTIVVRNGRIEAVGATVTAPAGAQEIDARGLWVFPGLMDASTNMGLAEIGAGVAGSVDIAEIGDMNPNAQAFFGINPHSSHIDVTRVNGITTTVSAPAGGVVSGQAAVINLAGTTPREMAVIPQAALVINFPIIAGGGGFGPPQAITPDALSQRERRVDELRRLLRDAEAYGRAQEAHARDPRNIPRPATDLQLAALVPYARGERPVMLRADRERDIRAAVRFAEEMRLRPVIVGASDAAKVAQLLKDKNVPVVFERMWSLPLREDDPYDELYSTPARLQQAGVRFAIATGDSGAEVRDLPYQAGMASSFGLPRAEALKAITLYPAQIMGVSDRLGSIETGKLANLVITDGDILDPRTQVRRLFIEGRDIPLVSRHTILNDMFKDRRPR